MNTKNIDLFQKCIEETNLKYDFIDEQKESFVRTLANFCNRKGIPIDKTKISIKEKYNFNDEAVTKIINQEYSNKKDFGIENRKSVEDYLNEKYDFKYNTVIGKIEYKTKDRANFKEINDYKLNSICRELENAEYRITSSKLYNLLISDYVPLYNPFKEYFNNLPEWDGHDHILELSNLVNTDDPDFWQDALKRWLVAMVACSLYNRIENHTVIVLNGGQGIGKSTFIDNILPPELREYKYSGSINPYNKDSLIMLSERILIDLDELGSLNRKDEKAMKELITKSNIQIRRPYGRINEVLPRRASFIGSVNDKEFLMDLTGTRRFLCFEVSKIDYKTKINYTGVYSQVMYLLKSGFKYWFEGNEIAHINERNEKFRMKSPIEEMILAKYQPCSKDETDKFLSSTEILDDLRDSYKINIDNTNNVMVGKILNKYGFQRIKKEGTYKYAIQDR